MSNQDKQQDLLTTLAKQLASNLDQPLIVLSQTTMFLGMFGVTVTPRQDQVQYDIIAAPGFQVGGGDATGKTTPQASTLALGPVNLAFGPFNMGTVEALFTTDLKASTATATRLTVALTNGPSGTFSVEVGSWAVSSVVSR